LAACCQCNVHDLRYPKEQGSH